MRTSVSMAKWSVNLIGSYDIVSHPFKEKGKFRGLYTLIFVFLDGRRKDYRFWAARQQAIPEFNWLSFSSFTQVSCVSVIPKCLNFTDLQGIYRVVSLVVSLSSILLTKHENILGFLSIYSRPTSLIVGDKAFVRNTLCATSQCLSLQIYFIF
jgi:hypothetical protein